jgi:hypothetical protein
MKILLANWGAMTGTLDAVAAVPSSFHDLLGDCDAGNKKTG